ncbi:MAG: GNAT family N-acetyltransferase [Actinomycetota bacterium]
MVDYRRLSPAEASAAAVELRAVYAEVFSLPPYNEGPEMADELLGRLAEESKLPGFSLVAVYESGRLLGFAYGYTMPAGKWWNGTDRPVPEGVKAADKFAVMEWAVVADRRGKGIGRRLLGELLAGRRERYATLTVNPAADARAIYERWGWRQVALTRPGKMPGMAVMLAELPGSTEMHQAWVGWSRLPKPCES